MTFANFVKAMETEASAIWLTISGGPAVKEIESIVVQACASELEAIVQKFLGDGPPIDAAVNALIQELAAKVIKEIPASVPALPQK